MITNLYLAYIFDSVSEDEKNTISLVNYKYDDNCLFNETISNQIKDFRLKFDQVKDFTDDDLKSLQRGFDENHSTICEIKRNKVRSVTDTIEPIGKYCVRDARMRKKFILNTLLMLQSSIDFVCSMQENVFNYIYRDNVVDCINDKIAELDKCREKAFKILFFDKMPQKLFWISLINGNVCNFHYDKMLACAAEHLEYCVGAIELLSYLFDVIKRNSICFRRKDISEILEMSSENSGEIVKL